jgi:hypothetical protein
MEIKRTKDIMPSANTNLLLYGEPKSGKSTFAASAKNALVCDVENGWSFMGSRGFDLPIVQVKNWDDMREFYAEASKPEYKTIIIDPVGELLDKLMIKAKTQRAYVQNTDPSALSMKGWGYVKDTMKQMLKSFRDMNKNIIFVAHTKNIEDDGVQRKTPKLDANLSGELMAMMDIIGYMFVINDDKTTKRVIGFRASPKYDAGDRSDTLPEYYNPNDGFDKLLEIISKNAKFNFNKAVNAKNQANKEKFLSDLEPSNSESGAFPQSDAKTTIQGKTRGVEQREGKPSPDLSVLDEDIPQ